MAIYLYLPVYKANYNLVLKMFKMIKDFNREYKYTLGENIKKEAPKRSLTGKLDIGIIFSWKNILYLLKKTSVPFYSA